jgi:hypothetical protein
MPLSQDDRERIQDQVKDAVHRNVSRSIDAKLGRGILAAAAYARHLHRMKGIAVDEAVRRAVLALLDTTG